MIRKIIIVFQIIIVLLITALVLNDKEREDYNINKDLTWGHLRNPPPINIMNDSLLKQMKLCTMSIRIVPRFNDPLIRKCKIILDIAYDYNIKYSIDLGTFEDTIVGKNIPCKDRDNKIAMTIRVYDAESGSFYRFPSKDSHSLFENDSVTIFLYNQIVQDAHGQFRVVAGHDVKDDYTDSD